MNTMIYKGHAARIEYSEEDGCFVGHLAGIRDIVGFDATTVDDVKERFHESVDDDWAACKKLKQTPDKPYSGRIMLRLPPELHARASAAAQVTGMSFNQWAARALEQAMQLG